jgi:hypothetical protein
LPRNSTFVCYKIRLTIFYLFVKSPSFYTFGKKLVQIFSPDLMTPQQWIYIDILAPLLLPRLDNKLKPQTSSSTSLSSSEEEDEESDENAVNPSADAWNFTDRHLFSSTHLKRRRSFEFTNEKHNTTTTTNDSSSTTAVNLDFLRSSGLLASERKRKSLFLALFLLFNINFV